MPSDATVKVEYVVRCSDDPPEMIASGPYSDEAKARAWLADVVEYFVHCGTHTLIELTRHADGTTTERDITEPRHD